MLVLVLKLIILLIGCGDGFSLFDKGDGRDCFKALNVF